MGLPACLEFCSNKQQFSFDLLSSVRIKGFGKELSFLGIRGVRRQPSSAIPFITIEATAAFVACYPGARD